MDLGRRLHREGNYDIPLNNRLKMPKREPADRDVAAIDNNRGASLRGECFVEWRQ